MSNPFSWLARSVLRLKDDELRGRFGSARGGGEQGGGKLGARLSKSLQGRRVSPGLPVRSTGTYELARDKRQRAVSKVSYRNHAGGVGGGGGGGGGGKLLAHGAYLQRDGAAREGERGHFYDDVDEQTRNVDERLEKWAGEDKRHFRLMLAPESGARLVGEDGDLKAFTRDVMARMERDLGVKLEWMAVDHHNTDNPHTHVILRGVRRDGVDLVLPREYVSHGLREAARDVATERLGERSIADERLRLDREVEGRGFNRLDREIAQGLGEDREVLVQSLGSPSDPVMARALRARARELARIGLAQEVRRNVLKFERDWEERLKATQALDLRRELARARLYEPRMGRVEGKVVELGPRGESPDRAALVLETPNRGRVLLNTSMEEISQVQRGSWAALEPEGKRARIERLSFHGLEAQVSARAETELDRDLDRRMRGERGVLPACPEVNKALEDRAITLEANGFGVRSVSGKFYFREGAREQLRREELDREQGGRSAGRADGVADRGLDGETWRVRDVKELFAGRAALLERGHELLVHPLGRGDSIAVGDEVTFRAVQGRVPTLELPGHEVVKAKGRGLDLGR